MLAESVSADCQVSQVVRQRVPHQGAIHGESPPGKCTPPLVRYVQQLLTSRSEMTSWRDVGDWLTDVKQVLLRLPCCRQLYIMTLSLYMTHIAHAALTWHYIIIKSFAGWQHHLDVALLLSFEWI